MESRTVAFIAFDEVQSLDVFGPLEAFHAAGRFAPGAYQTPLLTADGEPFTTSSGVGLTPAGALTEHGPVDTLLVAGGGGVRAAVRDTQLIAAISQASATARRTASVCTGAFLLAEAGLLDGKRATTHWRSCAALQRRYPQIDVDPAPIFVRDGDVYTSAGVTAGIDLALALIEEDLGRDVALDVARALVLFIRRPGGQAQFSAALAGQRADRDEIRDLQQWINEHLDHDLSVPALATKTCMSPRHFARTFAKEVGMTPAAFVTTIRVDRARALLETTDLQFDEIARRTGFGTVETLRRAFGRRLHVSPSDYRERFAA